MKLKSAILSIFTLMLGVSGVVYASNYFPPERINCSLDNAQKVVCEGFNRQFLAEDSFPIDLSAKSETFNFYSGAAYFSSDMKESTVFFIYKNSYGKRVRIKSTNTSIRPNLSFGSWFKFREDIYRCTAGYMNCPITNLPVKN